MSVSSYHLLFDHFQFTLIHGPNIPGSCAILLFTASDLASITSHIHKWVLFLLWLCLFILSGIIPPLTFSSPFSVLSFSLFILLMGFSRQEYWSGLPFPFPGDHILSELSTMTHPSWMALHSMAHSFTELKIKFMKFHWVYLLLHFILSSVSHACLMEFSDK